ncbi:hypothetical protein C8Q76DRAFT_780931 [Earliella scabrosa]|nr:hypothetical protein C8Q76DRAFT_780931 [Earliella scabrosa]
MLLALTRPASRVVYRPLTTLRPVATRRTMTKGRTAGSTLVAAFAGPMAGSGGVSLKVAGITGYLVESASKVGLSISKLRAKPPVDDVLAVFGDTQTDVGHAVQAARRTPHDFRRCGIRMVGAHRRGTSAKTADSEEATEHLSKSHPVAATFDGRHRVTITYVLLPEPDLRPATYSSPSVAKLSAESLSQTRSLEPATPKGREYQPVCPTSPYYKISILQPSAAVDAQQLVLRTSLDL